MHTTKLLTKTKVILKYKEKLKISINNINKHYNKYNINYIYIYFFLINVIKCIIYNIKCQHNCAIMQKVTFLIFVFKRQMTKEKKLYMYSFAVIYMEIR